ncbi:hypothetical protein BDW74DRAFT_177001 [Aspergillus multicolor]|uniref:uncharacterized protein n=1 Tax=Aspergillus multicolor TaxID=41759 RepID=UPI003CCCD0C3
MYGGAAVVYYEEGELVPQAFSLPDVEGFEEAEVRAIEQGLQLALDMMLNHTTNRRKVIVLSGSQQAQRLLAKHITGRTEGFHSSTSRAVAAAACNARRLRQLGVEVEILWSPGHMGIPGNLVVDWVARTARAYTQGLPDSRALELAGRVERRENPYSQR